MSKFIDLFVDLPSDYYSYLLSKTKAEKELLEFLGYRIEQTTEYISRVEFTNKIYNCSRMDLAILDEEYVPKEIIEAKFYYSFNGYRIHTQQLAKKLEVEKDVQKLESIPKSINKYFVLFLVHFKANEIPPLFPYFDTHNKVMSKFEAQGLTNSDLRNQSIEVAKQYLKEKGLIVEVKEFEVGEYDHIPVILQVFSSKIV